MKTLKLPVYFAPVYFALVLFLGQSHWINAQPLSIISGILQTETGKPVDAVIRAARVRTPPSQRGQAASPPLTPRFVNVSAKAAAPMLN